MEREMTGLYLSGHPMDAYRERADRLGAVPIGRILADYAAEGGPRRFADGQNVLVAGVVGAHRTRATRNNSMMAYVTLEDDSGSLELVVFQRALDSGGGYIRDNAALLVRGRISARDEKEPQITVDAIRPLSDLDGLRPAASVRKLFVRLPSTDGKNLRKLELLLKFFPGSDRLVLFFPDLGKQRSAPCQIHPALLAELRERLGEENVVLVSKEG